MWNQFILQNIHFAVSLFASLVFFAVFWLYLDAWNVKRTVKDGLKTLGFLLISFSFLVYAASVESTVITSTLFGGNVLLFLQYILRMVGYTFVFVSLASEKLEPKPKDDGTTPVAVVLPFQITGLVALQLVAPIFSLAITLLYLRKAYWGLEWHLRKVGFAFLLLSLFEVVSLSVLFRHTTNIELYKLVVPFGAFWIIAQVVLFIVCVLLGTWVFGYLLKQFKPQLFFIINMMILSIFLITTVSFTGLLLKNIQDETTRQLDSDVKVLQFTLEGKNTESKSDALLISQDPQLITAFQENNREKMNAITQQYLLTKKYSFLAVLNKEGQVVARGEDAEKVGDSLASDSLVKRVSRGDASSGIETKDGVLSPQLFASGAAPIIVTDPVGGVSTTIGAVILGTGIDNAFVDGIKHATGLEASIYGGNALSATTLLSTDGKTRLLGIKEEQVVIKKHVLEEGVGYSGSETIANTPFFVSYLPLKDIDGTPLGMIAVGRTQSGVLQTASKSIELTFIVATVMLLISVVPSYLIARYMSNQL